MGHPVEPMFIVLNSLTFDAQQFYVLQCAVWAVVRVTHKLEISPDVRLVVHLKLSYDLCRLCSL